MNVPAEIVDRILSFLQSDPETLRKCSNSHPLLSQFADPRLYSYIILTTLDSSSSHQSFHPSDLAKDLSKRPHIAHYVRNLQIQVIFRNDTKHYAQCQLEEISKILPALLALRCIGLDHTCAIFPFQWGAQPERFRLAFLACLRLPSMQDVSLTGVTNFPFESLLNEQYRSLKGFTLDVSTITRPLVVGGLSYPNRKLPFESICLQDHNIHGAAIREFIDWATTCVLQLRSLKFFSEEFESLPKLLTKCSTTLTNLYLNFGFMSSYYYNFMNDPPTIEEPTTGIRLDLSMVPYLEELTIKSKLHYIDNRQWGFFSGIPTITKLFSSKPPPSLRLRRLNLNYNSCFLSIIPQCPPSISISDVVFTPFIELLSTISAFFSGTSSSTHLHISLNGTALVSKSVEYLHISTPSSPLRDCEELRQFLHC